MHDLSITKIVIREIQMDLKTPLTNHLTTITKKRFLIVEVHDIHGVIGYGETVAFTEPWYTEETTDTCFYVLKEFLIPLLLEEKIKHPNELGRIFSKIANHHMAKTALECAVWDAFAQKQGVSLASLIGGKASHVEAGLSLGITKTKEELIERIHEAVETGYKRIKLKITHGWDIQILKAVREVFPNIPLMVDANGAYSTNDLGQLQQLNRFHLAMIEQPFPRTDMLEINQLKRIIDAPICLDENIDSYLSARLAIETNSVDIITLKPGRVGGIKESLHIVQLCKKEKLPIWIGGMFETGIGRALNIIIASTFHHALPGDIGESSHYWHEDLILEPFVIKDGYIEVPTKPGLGITVNRDILQKQTKSLYEFK